MRIFKHPPLPYMFSNLIKFIQLICTVITSSIVTTLVHPDKS